MPSSLRNRLRDMRKTPNEPMTTAEAAAGSAAVPAAANHSPSLAAPEHVPMTHAAERLTLFDSATHEARTFVPIKPGEISMYVCGATVQSSPHIGHMRAAVAFDVARRWFERLGYTVTFVRNVTDIDDKILAKAAQAGQKWWARAYHYEREFTHYYDSLGVLPPTYEPRATGQMPAMIDLVQRLLDRGHAYMTFDEDGNPTGNVYFDVQSWPQYGELTHQKTGTRAAACDADEEIAQRMGPSVDATGADKYNPADPADDSADKHDPRDFALWKAPKDTDPLDARWATPFGTGRPGWHLECSAMSHRYLGDDFDIHGGGLDLRFPHHENEMAQSKAAGWGFAHLWMHSAWVTQKGEKMSKSLGNGLSVDHVLAEHSPWVARYALASVHYRSMLEWSADTLDEAESAHTRILRFLDAAERFVGQQPSREAVESVSADDLPADFTAAMNDDINVANAVAVIFSTIRTANGHIAEGEKLAALPSAHGDSKSASQNNAARVAEMRTTVSSELLGVRAMLDTLGLDPLAEPWAHENAGASAQSSAEHEVLDKLVAAQLEQRAQARAAKDFATADAIRDRLHAAGIAIADGANGSTWSLQ